MTNILKEMGSCGSTDTVVEKAKAPLQPPTTTTTTTPSAIATSPLAPASEDSNYIHIDVSNMTEEQAKMLTDEDITQIEMGKVQFFRKLKQKVTNRDYKIIIDKSASMTKSRQTKDSNKRISRWTEAEEVVAFLAPQACNCDPDGITLYFFSEVNAHVKVPFTKYENIRTAEEVMNLFADKMNHPQSGTDMTSVLKDALALTPTPTTATRTPETILFITDGAPANPKTTMQCIIDATQRMHQDDELSISFIQVGDDAHAEEWLRQLDDDLKEKGAKFDIVDSITASQMKSMDFLSLVKKSIEG